MPPNEGPVVVRHSRLKDFRQCPLKHELTWNQRWTGEPSLASQLGTAWHEVLESHYTEIRNQQREHLDTHPHRNLRNFLLRTDPVEDRAWATIDKYPEFAETLDWMYEGYREQHGFDETWQILAIEEEIEAPLRDADGNPTRFVLQWHTDLLVRDLSTGYIQVIDHKSTKEKLRQIDIDLDDQFGLYVLGWRRIGVPAMIPVCNQARTEKLKRPMTLDERFARLNSYRTDIELHNIERDTVAACRALTSLDVQNDPYSAPDPRVCGWRCSVKEIHMIMRKSKDPWEVVPSVMESKGFYQRELDDPVTYPLGVDSGQVEQEGNG